MFANGLVITAEKMVFTQFCVTSVCLYKFLGVVVIFPVVFNRFALNFLTHVNVY